jgi:hypothetical protein
MPAAAVLLALGVRASGAQAGPAIQYGLQDDAWLAAGPGPNTLPARIALLKKLGVGIVRYNLPWDEIAADRPATAADPDDPAYQWGFSDPVLDALHDAGIPVLLTINGAPSWANGGLGPAYMPTSGSTIASFATAAASRYPWVTKWTIWNEPNQLRWLRPGSPRLYVTRLLNPAYAALHLAIPRVQVGTGGTAPRAAAGGLSPIAWLNGLHAARARFDAYSHNPYALSPQETPFAGACGYCATVTMASLPRLISLVDKDFGKKPIWLTEYGYQTSPPDRYLGVSWSSQALYVSEAALRAYQLPQVTVLIQYLYRDEPDLGAWQSGFQTVAGKIKPGFAAFRLPLAQVPGVAGEPELWGQIRTGSGRRSYALQELVGGRWKGVGGSRLTSASGVFLIRVDAVTGSRFRVWSPRDQAFSQTISLS